MKFAVLFFTFLASTLTGQAQAGLRDKATGASFSAYVHAYNVPQLFETNGIALDARLKLLDAAPAGAHVRIATFEFLNGAAMRRFSRHACLAAERGVRFELIVDSKNGDRPGVPDAFDGDDNAQVVEELLQYMANCGVEVKIYNHLEEFISVLGVRLPNLYGDPALNGQAVDPISLLQRVDTLLDRLGQVANEELARSGVRADFKPLLKKLRSLAFGFVELASVTKNAKSNDTAPLGYEGAVDHLERLYLELLDDPIWDAVPPAALKPALDRFVARLETEPVLHPVYEMLRRYNRVQHRKVFVVENGTEGCAILGGRNLGDPYLTDGPTSFIDGDVLFCRNHGAEASRAVDEAGASFDNLLSDRSGRSSDLVVRAMPRQAQYAFRYLVFPPSLAPRGLVLGRHYSGKLTPANRTLLHERSWDDENPVLGDVTIPGARNWRIFRSSWDEADDEIKRELLRRIGSETKEIYLEIAYAQFSPDLRAALEAALARGVRVRLVTNSFFVTDGMSKAIRAFMANWTDNTRRRYGSRFSQLLTSFDSGHMIHFKSAAFACQRDAAGNTVRSYLLGSHNFHPRSGRSDKENSLSWDEPSACDGLSAAGLVRDREAYYAALSHTLGTPALVDYPDFHAELAAAGLSQGDNPVDMPDHWVSRALRRMLFVEGETTVKLKNADRLRKVMGVAEGGGLTDLLGLLL